MGIRCSKDHKDKCRSTLHAKFESSYNIIDTAQGSLGFYRQKMTALERKQVTEKRLSILGITLVDNLPPIEDEDAVNLRSSREVAERILILTYLSCVATDPSLRQEVMMFLIHEGLWDKASEKEKVLFHKTPLLEEDYTNIFWRSESIWLLLWVINKIDSLDLPE